MLYRAKPDFKVCLDRAHLKVVVIAIPLPLSSKGLPHTHLGTGNPSPFKGEAGRGMGGVMLDMINSIYYNISTSLTPSPPYPSP